MVVTTNDRGEILIQGPPLQPPKGTHSIPTPVNAQTTFEEEDDKQEEQDNSDNTTQSTTTGVDETALPEDSKIVASIWASKSIYNWLLTIPDQVENPDETSQSQGTDTQDTSLNNLTSVSQIKSTVRRRQTYNPKTATRRRRRQNKARRKFLQAIQAEASMGNHTKGQSPEEPAKTEKQDEVEISTVEIIYDSDTEVKTVDDTETTKTSAVEIVEQPTAVDPHDEWKIQRGRQSPPRRYKNKMDTFQPQTRWYKIVDEDDNGVWTAPKIGHAPPVFLHKNTPFGADGQNVNDVRDVINNEDEISYGRVSWNKDRKRLEAVFIDEIDTFNQDILRLGAIDKPANNRGQIKVYCPKTATRYVVPEGFQINPGHYNRTVVVRADKNGSVVDYTTLIPELPEQTLKFDTPQNLDTGFWFPLWLEGGETVMLTRQVICDTNPMLGKSSNRDIALALGRQKTFLATLIPDIAGKMGACPNKFRVKQLQWQ